MATNPKEFVRTTSNAGMIGLAAFGGALIGFVLQLLVAYHFGAGTETDAYFMAQSTSELLSKLLLGGSITAVFIPMFVEFLTKGKRKNAWDMALNIFHLTATAYLALIIVLLVFARPFVGFIAPGFDGETLELTVSLLHVLLPSFFFLFLVEFATSMLYSLQKFALPAMLRIVAPSISIITIILLSSALGIFALAVGVVLGSIVQFGILGWGLKSQGLVYKFTFRPRDPVIKHLLYMVYPFIFSVLVTQGAGIVYRILVSDLTTGSLASLKFAEKITQLLTIMFLSSVTLVIFPLLAQKASEKDIAGIRNTIASSIRLVTFVTVPLVIGVALLRDPLIALLYQRGSFSVEDAQMTGVALLFLILGLTTNGISSIFGHAILALKQTRAAVAVTIASQAVSVSLFVLLTPSMGHAGLALGSSLTPLSAALLYYLYLSRTVPRLGTVFVHSTFGKTAILTLALAAVVVFTREIDTPAVPFSDLFLPTVLGAATFLGGAYFWRIHEMEVVMDIVRNKITKWT